MKQQKQTILPLLILLVFTGLTRAEKISGERCTNVYKRCKECNTEQDDINQEGLCSTCKFPWANNSINSDYATLFEWYEEHQGETYDPNVHGPIFSCRFGVLAIMLFILFPFCILVGICICIASKKKKQMIQAQNSNRTHLSNQLVQVSRVGGNDFPPPYNPHNYGGQNYQPHGYQFNQPVYNGQPIGQAIPMIPVQNSHGQNAAFKPQPYRPNFNGIDIQEIKIKKESAKGIESGVKNVPAKSDQIKKNAGPVDKSKYETKNPGRGNDSHSISFDFDEL